MRQLEAQFKEALYQQKSLEQWTAWMMGVVKQALKPYKRNPDFAKSARLFLLKWSLYSSVVIRNLTHRGAETSGSFHLLRLLHEEYMSFITEYQVALETGEPHLQS